MHLPLAGPKAKRLKGAGRKPLNEPMEEAVFNWIKDGRERHLRVTRKRIKEKAKATFLELAQQEEGEASKFEASDGWLHKFMVRKNLSLRKRTTTAQKPPADYIPKLVKFVMFVRRCRITRKYPYGAIWAADETAVWAGATGDSTVDLRGVKDVPIKATGSEKFRLTVLLCAREDGRKEKPFVLLNRKRQLPVLKKFETCITFNYAGTNWMNEQLTLDFLHRTFGKLSFSNRLLVWDSFKCHISEKILAEMKRMNLDCAVIPGGCTGFIQAPDVSWNKPFKAKYRELYDAWCLAGNLPTTAAGNTKPPPLDKVCEWILASWNSVTKEIIIKSFKICGLSVATDGTEDEQIECFKDGHACADGREMLREENAEFQKSLADGEEIEEVQERILELNQFGFEEEDYGEEDEVVID